MQTEKVIDPLKSVRLLRAHRSQLIDQVKVVLLDELLYHRSL